MRCKRASQATLLIDSSLTSDRMLDGLVPVSRKSDFWGSPNKGIDQVGCVYTAQGFEFDYVGVIFGPDFVYRPMDGG
jgi:hypothetical protein